MIDCKQYILTDIQQIFDLEVKHGKRFRDYLDKVCLRLENLKPGESFDIASNIKEPNLDVFIKCACLFVMESKGTYEFTDDYRVVRRMFVAPVKKKKCL